MTVERFMAVLGEVDQFACWPWPQAKDRNGYGKVHVRREDGRITVVVPHKWFYEQVIRPVPSGFELDHAACQRRDCVNPAHLEEVTHKQNMERGAQAQKTHCKYGHPLADAYVYVSGSRRSRICRTCRRHFDKRKYLTKKARIAVFPAQ